MPKKKSISVADWLLYFEKLHPVGIDMGLSRVSAVWQVLCTQYNIEKVASDSIITVSGTNGKGSTCQMLSLLLQSEGKKVGMYTSPHIHHFNERVQINGDIVADSKIVCAFEAIESARGGISLSYFEATTLVGLLIFSWEKVDYAVLEVGLGGRLDAINIIDADAAIITSVGLDHELFLGNDLGKIALEKAGVFRADKPAIFSQHTRYQSVVDHARDNNIPLLVCGQDYQRNDREIFFKEKIYILPESLRHWGEHQLQNASAVIVLLSVLQLLPYNYHDRLCDFSLPGRLQVVSEKPRVVVDVAHNYDAASALAHFIGQQNHQGKVFALIGMLADKDHKRVLSLFDGVFDVVYFASTGGERGFSGKDLQAVWNQCNSVPSKVVDDFGNCLLAVQENAEDEDVIYAFGSFLVAEALT